MTAALEGIRILDLTRIMAGPSATQMLGDLGADVIKVERRLSGDDTRGWGPPYLEDRDGNETKESVYFLSANRNKRSITLDFETTEGGDIARRLAGRCDVFFENYKVGGLAKYGLGYDQLKDAHPRLVYCSLTGFGQTGPYAARPGYDLLAQAMGGLMSITAEEDGEPVKVGVAIADILTGLQCQVAILAALRHRDLTGEGQRIDIALLDTQVAWLVNEGMNYLHTGKVPKAWGTGHATIVPFQSFPTADGHVVIPIGNDRQYRRFCEFAGVPALADDDRFRTNDSRVRNRELLVPLLMEATRKHPSRHWLEGLERVGVPAGPVNAIDQVFADPQVRARGMRVEIEHPAAGRPVPFIASAIKMDKTPPDYRRPPPMLGQHTEEVLAELLGLSEAEISGLRAREVI